MTEAQNLQRIRMGTTIYSLNTTPKLKPNVLRDYTVTICKNCDLSIYEGQPYEWQRQPRMGLVHTLCTARERAENE